MLIPFLLASLSQTLAWAGPAPGAVLIQAGSSQSVTSLCIPPAGSSRGCRTGSLPRGREACRRFPFPNPSLAAAAPVLGHPTAEDILQRRFARGFNDQTSSCAQNRIISCFSALYFFKHLVGAEVSWLSWPCFSLRSEGSLFFPAWPHLSPSELVKRSVLLCVASAPCSEQREVLGGGWQGQDVLGRKGFGMCMAVRKRCWLPPPPLTLFLLCAPGSPCRGDQSDPSALPS